MPCKGKPMDDHELDAITKAIQHYTDEMKKLGLWTAEPTDSHDEWRMMNDAGNNR